MSAFKLLNILAVASVFILALSSGPVPANALVADRAQVARHAHAHARDAVARRRRRDTSPTCQPRPSSAPAYTPVASDTPTPSATPAPAQTTPSPSPSPSASPAPSTNNNGGKKMGLAWGMGSDAAAFAQFDLPNVGYVYNWSPDIPSGIPNGIEFIPQLWGYNQVADFQQTVVAGYAKKVFGFNEPNELTQANMSPQDAMNLWMTYINPLQYAGYYLISPACTDDELGLEWYREFFTLCAQVGCHVDAIAFHAYTTNAQDLINYANYLYGNYSLPIWITEFADENFTGVGGQAGMSDVWNFAGQVMAFVEATEWLVAAFPYGVMTDLNGVDMNNALLDPSTNSVTPLGYFYFG